MKILAIANSFSQDATTFLHQTAKAQGVDLDVYNLYIGGCPLEKHWANWETGEAAYQLQHNGEATGRMVSIQEMLKEGGWDVISTQQASHDSGWMDTYEPFLGQLTEVFRREAPNARLLLQETWAYDTTSTHGGFARYRRSQQEMYQRLRRCYTTMAETYGLELIPCGDVIQQARALPAFCMEQGGRSLCRDGFHMSFGYGRYLLALVWIKTLCGASVQNNTYVPEGPEDVEEALLQVLRDLVG